MKSGKATNLQKKKIKKRASKYEKKLAVNVSFEELVAISLSPTPQIKKEK